AREWTLEACAFGGSRYINKVPCFKCICSDFLTDFEFFNIQVFEFTNEALRESSGSFSMSCFRFVCILIGFSTFKVFAFVVETDLYSVIAVSFFNFLLYYYVTCCFYYCYWNQLSVFTEN